MPATSVWLARMESVLNRAIAESSGAATAAARLQGTSIDIHIEPVTRIRAAVVAGRLSLMSAEPSHASADAPRAVIRGSPFALLRAAVDRGAATASAGLDISGDAEIAAGYRVLLRLATPDLEEQIARLLGDTPARAIGNFFSRSLSYLQRTRRTVELNIAEYLQEESRDLVSRTEVDEFLHGVDSVRETADRVDARLRELEQRLKGTA